MTRCIWITLQVHRVMQEFIQGGLQSNSTITTAFIVVAGGWPSALLAGSATGNRTPVSLGLPLVGVCFPARFHRYFKPKGGVTSWSTPSALNTTSLPAEVGLLASGSERFIDRMLGTVGPTRRIIASVETGLRGATVRELRKNRASAKAVLTWHGMQAISFLDSENGGATDACHMFGFDKTGIRTSCQRLRMGCLLPSASSWTGGHRSHSCQGCCVRLCR
jgi:hypothetical protein